MRMTQVRNEHTETLIRLAQEANTFMSSGDLAMCNSLMAEINSVSGILYQKLKKQIEIEQHKTALKNAKRSKIYG